MADDVFNKARSLPGTAKVPAPPSLVPLGEEGGYCHVGLAHGRGDGSGEDTAPLLRGADLPRLPSRPIVHFSEGPKQRKSESLGQCAPSTGPCRLAGCLALLGPHHISV